MRMRQETFKKSYYIPAFGKSIEIRRNQDIDEDGILGKELLAQYGEDCILEGETKSLMEKIASGDISGSGTSLTTEQTDAIEKIKGLEASASEIDGNIRGEKKHITNYAKILDNLVLSEFNFTAGNNASCNKTYVAEGEYGENVIKIEHLADGRCWGYKEVLIDNSIFFGKELYFTQKVKLSNGLLAGQIIFYFKMSNGTEYAYFKYLNLTHNRRDGDWNYITISTSDIYPQSNSIPFKECTANITRIYIGTLSCKAGLIAHFSDLLYKVKQEPTFSFSFDDGNLTDVTIAKKILDRFNFKATTSIIGSLIGNQNFLTKAQVKYLYDCGWDVACHGLYNHANTLVTYENIEADVQSNIDLIKSCGIPNLYSYVYPEGGFNRESIQVLKEKGFKIGMATNIGSNILSLNNRFYISRNETDIPTIEQLKLIVDKNIEAGGHVDFYAHKLVSTPQQYLTLISKYTELVEYIAEKTMAGQCEVIRLIDAEKNLRV